MALFADTLATACHGVVLSRSPVECSLEVVPRVSSKPKICQELAMWTVLYIYSQTHRRFQLEGQPPSDEQDLQVLPFPPNTTCASDVNLFFELFLSSMSETALTPSLVS